MSELVNQQQAAVAAAGDPSSPQRDHHHHLPHVAHHFQSAEQQFNSAKVGMWVFLATEILMFGGLFCAYTVYRYNHPDVFLYAHHYLDKTWGAINTVVLITSSLTMAWGVRAAMLGQKTVLVVCLALTLLGGVGFMVIKGIEYNHKFHEHVWFGAGNKYSRLWDGPPPTGEPAHGPQEGEHGAAREGEIGAAATDAEHGAPAAAAEAKMQYARESANAIESTGQRREGPEGAGTAVTQPATAPGAPRDLTSPDLPAGHPVERIGAWVDPNAGTPDEAKIKPTLIVPAGLAPPAHADAHHAVTFGALSQFDRARIATFFNIYFLMTGLHGLHVLIGMGLISWVLIRALGGAFGPLYFTPVDLVGLYWHLVDLIWIFLFPLLYLIH